MFQNSPIAGVLFIVAIAISSLDFALSAMIGVLSSTITAKILRCSDDDIDNGIYGFNGVLIAIAVVLFFELNLLAFLYIIISASLTTIIYKYALNPIVPVYTAPFIALAWVFAYLGEMMGLTPSAISSGVYGYSYIEIAFRNISQILFCDNYFSGVLIALALLFSSKKSFLWVVVASISAVIVADIVSLNSSKMVAGLYGYNAILTAIALSLYFKNRLVILAGALFSIAILELFFMADFIAFTAPFVISCWIFILLHKGLKSIGYSS